MPSWRSASRHRRRSRSTRRRSIARARERCSRSAWPSRRRSRPGARPRRPARASPARSPTRSSRCSTRRSPAASPPRSRAVCSARCSVRRRGAAATRVARSRRAKAAREPRRPVVAPEPAAALPLRHPAMLAVALVAAACIVFSVTYRLIDSDFWQHLLVGKVIWARGAIPRQHLWSWTSYGRSEVLPSWLFRWLLWPFYERGGIPGLFAWRWITTLGAFGFAWATARRLGARGLAPLVVIAWCALVYRSRSQVRPETLAAVLLAAEMWILERARHGDRRALPGLVPITWIWVNAHVSYFIAFVLLGLHGVGAWRGWSPSRATVASRDARPFLWVGLGMVAIAFANPFGWAALWQPFDYALHLSREPLFRGIGELQPVTASTGWRYGLWLMVVGWPLLMLLRARRDGLDKVEGITAALVTAYALPSQRFLGVYALVAAPYLARDLETWIHERRWPRWTRPVGARAALAALTCVAISI